MENLMGKIAEKLSAQEMIKANTAAEAAHREQLEMQNKQYEEELKVLRQNAQILEKNLKDMKDEMEQRFDKSDEATHDVGVRIYRNVQASVAEEQQKQLDEIRDDLKRQMDSLRKEFTVMTDKINAIKIVPTKQKGLIPLMIIAILLSGANLVLFILKMLGLV